MTLKYLFPFSEIFMAILEYGNIKYGEWNIIWEDILPKKNKDDNYNQEYTYNNHEK